MSAAATSKAAAGADIPVPDRSLADRPVAFLKAQIDFLRALCGLLDEVCTGQAREACRGVYHAVCGELGLLLQDRRANVLPVLRRCAVEEDEVDRLSETLEAAYRAVERDAETLARALSARRSVPARTLRDPAGDLGQYLRQLIAIESSVLIPLVRVRLSAQDYEVLAAAFRARRERRPHIPREIA